jgi:hypothetical protein
MTERGVPRPIPWIRKNTLYDQISNNIELSVLKQIVDAFPALITLYQTTTNKTLLAPVNSAILAIPDFATLLSTADPWLETFARYILLSPRVNYLDFINDTTYPTSNGFFITANVVDNGDSYDVGFQDVLNNQTSIISRGYIASVANNCNMLITSALLIPSNPP